MPATEEITEAQQLPETGELLPILIHGATGKHLQLPPDFLPEIILQLLPMRTDAPPQLSPPFPTAGSLQIFPVQLLFAAAAMSRSPHLAEQVIRGTQQQPQLLLLLAPQPLP